MTAHDPPAGVTRVIVAHTTLARLAREEISLYLGILIFLLAFVDPAGGLIGIPIGFFGPQ